MFDSTSYSFEGLDLKTIEQGYGTSDTAAETTEKVVDIPSYTLFKYGIVSVRFLNDVPANSTLNVNNQGAYPIIYRNAAITDGVIKAQDTATFIFDGVNFHLIALDTFHEISSDIEQTKSELTETLAEQNKQIQEFQVNQEAAFRNLMSMVSGTFSELNTYEIGDYVIYENSLYQFEAAHDEGAWNPDEVRLVTISDIMKKLYDAGWISDVITPNNFDIHSPNEAGDYVFYPDETGTKHLYRFEIAREAEDEWDPMIVTEVNIGSELNDLRNSKVDMDEYDLLRNLFSEYFDENKVYDVGDWCLYKDEEAGALFFYQFNAYKEEGPWDPSAASKATFSNITEMYEELLNSISEATDAVTHAEYNGLRNLIDRMYSDQSTYEPGMHCLYEEENSLFVYRFIETKEPGDWDFTKVELVTDNIVSKLEEVIDSQNLTFSSIAPIFKETSMYFKGSYAWHLYDDPEDEAADGKYHLYRFKELYNGTEWNKDLVEEVSTPELLYDVKTLFRTLSDKVWDSAGTEAIAKGDFVWVDKQTYYNSTFEDAKTDARIVLVEILEDIPAEQAHGEIGPEKAKVVNIADIVKELIAKINEGGGTPSNTVIVPVLKNEFIEESPYFINTISVDGIKEGMTGFWDIVRESGVITYEESEIVLNIIDVKCLEGAIKITCTKVPSKDFQLILYGTYKQISEGDTLVTNLGPWFEKVDNMFVDISDYNMYSINQSDDWTEDKIRYIMNRVKERFPYNKKATVHTFNIYLRNGQGYVGTGINVYDLDKKVYQSYFIHSYKHVSVYHIYVDETKNSMIIDSLIPN